MDRKNIRSELEKCLYAIQAYGQLLSPLAAFYEIVQFAQNAQIITKEEADSLCYEKDIRLED